MKYFATLFIIFFCHSFLFAQKEANIWYFGDSAGVDFNDPVPVALTDGVMNTNEGCASIADKNGSLLFYTDGSIVWNSIHDTMPNGKGLKGNFSSTQSAIIVPRPGSDSLYYVFTVDEEGGPDGLNYSEIDISLNGGLGDVTATKNVPLVTPTAEKITAVVHANGTDIWVITHEMGTDGFYAYLITPSGVNPVPTISNIGTVIPLLPTTRSHGYLKASPDGKYISMATEGINGELFDFDNSTGLVSNPIVIVPNGVYGTEFSPNSQLLYMVETGVLTQYDINASNIVASRTVIDSSFFSFITSLQLGPDGKMYVARLFQSSLGVINNPNVIGLGANFNAAGINLGTGVCLAGLPSFIQSFFVDPKFTYSNICNNQTTIFSNKTPTFDSLLWDFDDPASGMLNTDTSTDPTHKFTDTGSFTVSLIAYNGSLSDTFIQIVRISPTSSSINVINMCAGDSIFLEGAFQTSTGIYFDTLIGGNAAGCDSTITTTLTVDSIPDATISQVGPFCYNAASLNLTAVDTGGTWSGTGITNATNGTFDPAIALAGNYIITYTIAGTCGNMDTTIIVVNPVISNTNAVNICAGDSVFLEGAFQTNTGVFYDTIIGGSILGCDSITTTTLTVNLIKDATIDPVDSFCSNISPFNLTAADTGGIWAGIGITNSINGTFDPSVASAGNHDIIYTIADPCGSADTITIIVNPLPTLSLCCDDTIQFGGNSLLNATGTPPFNWTPPTWLDNLNSSSPITTPDSTITYYITQTSSEGCIITDSITIYVINELLQIPNSFTPNNDGLNDEFKVFQNGLKNLNYFKIYNRWGQTVYFSKDLQAGWDGNYNGKPQEIGTYHYEFSAVNFDGNAVSQSGTIALIR